MCVCVCFPFTLCRRLRTRSGVNYIKVYCVCSVVFYCGSTKSLGINANVGSFMFVLYADMRMKQTCRGSRLGETK